MCLCIICTKWSKDAVNGQYFQKFTKFQERIRNFGEYLKKSLIFHSHSFRVHSCCFFWVFFGWPPKTSSKLIELVIWGPNLIELTKFGSKPLTIHWNAMKITKNGVGLCFFGGQTHLVHDTKWANKTNINVIFLKLFWINFYLKSFTIEI